MRWLYPLLIFVPISIVQYFMHVSPVWLFLSSCLSIIPLAGVMGVATEEYSKYRGQAVGGLLNATFGNATEMIIAIVAVFNGKVEIVRASLIGSIIGNLLLVFGLATLLGGLKFKEQKFNRHSAEANGSMMTISVISLLVPAIFIRNSHLKDTAPSVANLSLAVAVLLIALYIGGLIFSLKSHKSFFQDEVKHEGEEEEKPSMSQAKALGILIVSTLFIAFESEFLVSSIEPVVHQLHMSELFLGIILIPIIVYTFHRIHHHYTMFARELTQANYDILKADRTNDHVVVIPISGLHRGVMNAIRYGQSISHDLRICFVQTDDESGERMKASWMAKFPGKKLYILESPYRSISEPILRFIDEVAKEHPTEFITVIFPEFVTAKWYHQLLHNQTAWLIKLSLIYKKRIIVTSVKYHLTST